MFFPSSHCVCSNKHNLRKKNIVLFVISEQLVFSCFFSTVESECDIIAAPAHSFALTDGHWLKCGVVQEYSIRGRLYKVTVVLSAV